MKNIFLWLSGVDKNILENCPQGEQTKFVGYGTLVLIPAITGLFSMSYAISTITSNIFIIVLASFTWFLFVLFVDRFLVSTLYKSKHTPAYNYVLSLIVRYIFAIFVGITVAHPLVLLIFNNNILEEVYSDKRDLLTLESLRRNNDKKQATSKIDSLIELRNCYYKLLQAEKNRYRVILPCGFTSGLQGEGSSYNIDKMQLDVIEKMILDIEPGIKNDLIKIDNKFKLDSINIEKNFSTDYLKRVNTLENLKRKPENSHIASVEFFLIIFFVLIDILPITMKAATPYGVYERRRDNKIFKINGKLNGQEEALSRFYNNEYIISQQKTFEFSSKNNEIHNITISTVTFFNSLEEIKDDFSNFTDRAIKKANKISNNAQREYYLNKIYEIQDIYNLAYSISLTKYKESLSQI